MLSRVEHFAEHYAVSAQQHVADGFERIGALGGRVHVQQRPAAGAVARAGVAAGAVPGAALGIDQRAEIVEAVGGEQAAADQFPQRGFDFGFDSAGAAHDFGEE